MKKLTKEKLKEQKDNAAKSEKKSRTENNGVAQCCAKVSKIVAGCHD